MSPILAALVTALVALAAAVRDYGDSKASDERVESALMAAEEAIASARAKRKYPNLKESDR
jgi:hypothetical protein